MIKLFFRIIFVLNHMECEKRRCPNGKGAGYPDKKGNVWEPTDHKGTHPPHWDIQLPNGTHTPKYPTF